MLAIIALIYCILIYILYVFHLRINFRAILFFLIMYKIWKFDYVYV